MRKKKTSNREVGLGFESKILKNDKQKFEDKITSLFKEATAEVRRQAKYVDWGELKIYEMIQPQIVKDTV